MSKTNIELGDLAREMVIIPKKVIDIFLEQNNPGDLMALYCMYVLMIKTQESLTVKTSHEYIAKHLNWSNNRVKRAEKQLVALGFAERFNSQEEADNG